VDEADLLEDALRGDVLRKGHGHEPRQTHLIERVAGEGRGRFGGKARAPRGAGQPIRQLDVVTVGHAQERGHSVESAVVPALDHPPAERAMIRGDAITHARHDLLGSAATAPDVAHDLRVAVQGDEPRLVGGAQAAQAELPRVEHEAAG